MKIVITPVEISGIAQGLHTGFFENGVESEVCLSSKHPFMYGVDGSEPWIVRVWQFFGSWRSRFTKSNVAFKFLAFIFHNLWGWVVLCWALRRFDSFIFLFGLTFTNTRLELWLLRALGRKIIFVYVGSDSRPPFMDGSLFPGAVYDSVPSAREIYRVVRRVKCRVKVQEKYADHIICSPASAQYLTKPFVSWFSMGIPKSFPASETGVEERGEVVRVLHAPSNSIVKGTPIILQALEGLRKRGYLIEVDLVQGRTNSEVLVALQRCDFVVDQLYADTPLAAIASEAAFFGKPSVVAGYFSESVQQHVCKEDIPPSFFVLPSDLEAAIEKLIVDVRFRRTLGEHARRYVLEQWSPNKVASRYIKLLQEHDAPSCWLSDPYSIRYVDGNGLDRKRTVKLVQALVGKYGPAALMLTDKPELEKALLSQLAGDLSA